MVYETWVDAPPSSLMDSIVSSKVKTMEGELGHALWFTTFRV
jgi:hypothetical protein